MCVFVRAHVRVSSCACVRRRVPTSGATSSVLRVVSQLLRCRRCQTVGTNRAVCVCACVACYVRVRACAREGELVCVHAPTCAHFRGDFVRPARGEPASAVSTPPTAASHPPPCHAVSAASHPLPPLNCTVPLRRPAGHSFRSCGVTACLAGRRLARRQRTPPLRMPPAHTAAAHAAASHTAASSATAHAASSRLAPRLPHTHRLHHSPVPSSAVCLRLRRGQGRGRHMDVSIVHVRASAALERRRSRQSPVVANEHTSRQLPDFQLHITTPGHK